MPSRTILSTSSWSPYSPGCGFFSTLFNFVLADFAAVADFDKETSIGIGVVTALKPRWAKRRGAAETAGAVEVDGEVDDGIFAIKTVLNRVNCNAWSRTEHVECYSTRAKS